VSLLAPFWILLAGAAAVPLLLHLMRRRSGVRTEFPAARYLARAEREHSRSLRLRNLLLMLIRVCIILFIALAAARPAARWSGWASTRSPAAVAIVLDNSLSTSVVAGGQPVLESLRDTARHVLAAATDADRIWVVTADGRVAGGNVVSARDALAAVRPLAGAGDMGAALRVAAATVAGAGAFTPRVVVLTDAQRSAWTGTIDPPEGVEFVVVTPASAPPANRGVVTAAPRPERWTPRGALEVAIHTMDTVAFRVVLLPGGVPATVARGSFVPGEPQLVRVAPDSRGWVAGRVEIDADEMPGDDVRWFAAWVGAPPPVLATTGAGPFVRSALDVLKSEGRARAGGEIRFMAAHEVEGQGAVFLTAPESPAQLGAANQALARRGIPWRLGAGRPGGRLRGDGVDGAAVRDRVALVATAAARVDTLATVDGEPWAVAGVTPQGPYVLVASALVPGATTLPVRAAFVPWIAALLFERLAGGQGGVIAAAPSALVPMPAWADSLMVQGTDAAAIGGAEFTAPAVPGVHFFSQDGRRVGALVVNAEDSESILARMTDSELAGVFGATPPRLARTDPAWRDALFAGEGARALVTPVLLAVLGLLLLELAVTAVRTRGTA
jgi:hypothetical protein